MPVLISCLRSVFLFLFLTTISQTLAQAQTSPDERQKRSSRASSILCIDCRTPITGPYILSDQQPYCKSCWEKHLPICATCGHKITGEHITSDNKTFCSQACFEKTLPICELCRTPLTKAMTIDGHFFCALHAKGPRCASCGLPSLQQHHLEDGRMLCHQCWPNAILTTDAATPIYQRALAELKSLTGYQSSTPPIFELVDSNRLKKISPNLIAPKSGGAAIQQGVYHRSERQTNKVTTEVTENIFLLSGLSPPDFLAVATHELTHGLLMDKYPKTEFAPLWVKEGVSQYAAACVLRRYRAEASLRAIEEMSDETYGHGYRYFQSNFGPNNWPAVASWLNTTNFRRLPDRPPTTN